MSDDNAISPLFKYLFFPPLDEDDDDTLGKSLYTSVNRGGDSNVPDPVGDFLARAAANQLLAKSGDDWDWDTRVTAPRIELSEDFLKRNAARMQRVVEQLRKTFGEGHEVEVAEAVKIVQNIFDAEREAVIGRAA